MKLIFFLFVLFCCPCFSQTVIADSKSHQKPFIEVEGTASLEVKPDKIDLSIILSERNSDNSENNLDKQELSLKNAVAEMAIPNTQLSLADINSSILIEKRRDQTIKRTKEYYLRLSSAEQVSILQKKLSDANIKEVKIISLDHSKIDSLRKQVRIAPIKAAKDKAIYLTTAIGERIDKALEIREVNLEPINQSYVQTNLRISKMNMEENDSAKIETDFRNIRIRFSYYIKYSLVE